jgi:hypothetical protein
VYQPQRRAILARARNHLLFRALDDEDWVLWLDVDVVDYPTDILEHLIGLDLDIVHPHCVNDYGGKSFDLNAWRDNGRLHMDDMRGCGRVRLDSVGGTMLLVRAERHRDGLVFPSFFYGGRSRWVRVPNPWQGDHVGEITMECAHPGEFQKTAPILHKTATNKTDPSPVDRTQHNSPVVV